MLCAPLDFVKSASSVTLVVASRLFELPKTVGRFAAPSRLMLYSGTFLIVAVGGSGISSPMELDGFAADKSPSGTDATNRENETLKSPRKVGEKRSEERRVGKE